MPFPAGSNRQTVSVKYINVYYVYVCKNMYAIFLRLKENQFATKLYPIHIHSLNLCFINFKEYIYFTFYLMLVIECEAK
jgi:hypothetical protein